MRDLERFGRVLLDQEDRRSLRVDLRQNPKDRFAEDRRESERRLVEHEELRACHQRATDRQHLLLAAGERPGELFRTLFQTRKELIDARDVRWNTGAILPCVGPHHQIVEDDHSRKEASALRGVADPDAHDIVRRHRGDVLSIEDDASGRGVVETRDRPQRRGLAGSVRADQRDDLSGIDAEGDAAEGLDPSVEDVDARDIQKGHASAASPGTPR